MSRNLEAPSFDREYWSEAVQRPDWYLELVPYVKEVQQSLDGDSEQLDRFNYTVRHFIEEAVEIGAVALASSGPNLDEQRLPVDTLVVHHTSNKPGYRLSYLNAVQMVNIYAPYFVDPKDSREKFLKGQPLWSGHFKDGKQVFWGYHWLMRMDGTFEKLLEDEQIGWQAGNWEINRRSVAVCLDNDYEDRDPTDDTLRKLAAHISKRYPNIHPDKIIGHCEARDGTICPGGNFLTGWKPELLKYLNGS